MKKKLLVAMASVLVITLGVAGYTYYQNTQPLSDPKYRGVVTYRECSALELSLWCGRIYLDTTEEDYFLSGDTVSRELVGKTVELHGELVETEDGGKTIRVQRVKEE